MNRAAGWKRVVFAADCLDLYGDGEVLECPRCSIDYSECGCPGPHQSDEFEYREVDGVLMARKLSAAARAAR